MNSTSKKPNCVEKHDGKDRLSELPDEILLHILSFLPILDVVRTVSLRRFGYLWTSLPSLKFKDLKLVEAEYGPNSSIHIDEYLPRFNTFVRNVLILHTRFPIDKFHLSFTNMNNNKGKCQPYLNEITTWTTFAIGRQVKELEIISYAKVESSVLPQCVFTSQFLVKLKLAKFQINKLSRVHLVSLRILSLSYVEVSEEVFDKIISGSPSLQELDLDWVFGLNELHFSAPNIEKLKLNCYQVLLDCPNLKILDVGHISKSIQVVDISSVREVHIHGHCRTSLFETCVKQFCSAEVFTVSGLTIFQSSELKKLHLPQTKWKRLHIESWLRADHLLGICGVLKCSPHLEELIVYTKSQHSWGSKHDADIISQEYPSCLMQQLKIVTLRGYKIPCLGLLQLANILLKSSVTLEKLVILLKNSAAHHELMFIKQLVSFPRASTNALIIVDAVKY